MPNSIYILEESNLCKKRKDVIIQNCMWYNQLKCIFQSFDNIPYAIIKGEVLSIQAYGEVGFRSSGDVDILVPREYSQMVNEILKANGFDEDLFDSQGNKKELTRYERIIFKNSHQIIHYTKIVNNKRSVPLDINVDIFWGEYSGRRINIADFLSDTIEMQLYGARVKVLPDIKHFIVLCLHHYREMNAPYHIAIRNPFTERMFEDIYRFYIKSIRNNFQIILDFAFEYHLEDELYYVLFYTSKVFKDIKMEEEIEVLKTPDGVIKLNCYGLTNAERKEWPIAFNKRMNHTNIMKELENQLTKTDVEKINMALSIFE